MPRSIYFPNRRRQVGIERERMLQKARNLRNIARRQDLPSEYLRQVAHELIEHCANYQIDIATLD